MWPVFPASLTAVVVLVALALFVFSMRVVQPAWWRSRRARAFVLVASGGITGGFLLWGLGRATGRLEIVHAGAAVAYVGVIAGLPAALVMPFAALLDRLVVGTRAAATDDASKVSRRALLRLGAGSLPAAAAIASTSGLVSARVAPRPRVVRLSFPGLHPDLEGFRILQLSDLHLGACASTLDLARALAAARELRPDLVVLTGDLADDPGQIPEALRLVDALGARHGAFASLGNHEYLHDIDVTRPLYEASPVPLLVGTGRAIRVGRATLFVGGTDDPVHMGGDIPWFLGPSIRAAAAACPEEADFRLLLCHRPEGFGPAADAGFDLTLAGHTHGGQLGLFGRSLLERIWPGIGWWGTYARGRRRLYTTSGFGHWFPFRFGCPTEMPLIVLEAGLPLGADVAHSTT